MPTTYHMDILESNENQIEEREDVHNDSTSNASTKTTTKSRTLVNLPLTRVKNIMKSDPDVALTGQETVLLIAKMTELFIGHLAHKAYHYTKLGKRKTLQDKDIYACVTANDELSFLEGILDNFI